MASKIDARVDSITELRTIGDESVDLIVNNYVLMDTPFYQDAIQVWTLQPHLCRSLLLTLACRRSIEYWNQEAVLLSWFCILVSPRRSRQMEQEQTRTTLKRSKATSRTLLSILTGAPTSSLIILSNTIDRCPRTGNASNPTGSKCW